ncbi:hypothetical protein [Nocardia sp. NPDC056100]|uniref:hypothetical protein n=1 Tax=Nocardia sp. NPDC056100 TaxID=3345712 RepID=UPI0035DAF9B3
MEFEHEEAMREAFREQASLHARVYQTGVTLDEIGECFSKAREIHGQWSSGPHADQWGYLMSAYEAVRRGSSTTDRFLDNIEVCGAHGCDSGLDDVQHRSLRQAKELAQPRRIRARGHIQRER